MPTNKEVKMNILTQNRKMKKASDKIFNFDIPAYKSSTGQITCPYAGTCKNACYAQMGTFTWSPVKNAMERRLALTKQKDFVSIMVSEIKRRKIMNVRIHASGDFYSLIYLNKWLDIMAQCPETKFYAYTKSIPFIKSVVVPENFTVIYSFGGKLDKLIDIKKDRHSKVFSSLEALKAQGYSDASTNDSVAYTPNLERVGLIYHGYKSKATVWETI